MTKFQIKTQDIDLGRDGSKWKHGWIPLNAVAVAIKERHKTGGVTPISHHGSKGTAVVKPDGKGKGGFSVIHSRTHPTTGRVARPTVKNFPSEASAHDHAWRAVGGTERLTSHRNGKIEDISPKIDAVMHGTSNKPGENGKGSPRQAMLKTLADNKVELHPITDKQGETVGHHVTVGGARVGTVDREPNGWSFTHLLPDGKGGAKYSEPSPKKYTSKEDAAHTMITHRVAELSKAKREAAKKAVTK